MKKLSDLFPLYPDVLINDIKINSKEVTDGDLFYCVSGVTANRNNYIEEAIKNGASCIVTNKKIKCSVPVVCIDNPDKELSKIVSKFYDHPEDKLTLIAVTGTNGKTTVASIIQDLIGDNICGYIGTNGIKCSLFDEDIVNTTPDAARLYKYFSRFVNANCKYISMEASSEAFYRKRLDNLKYKVGIVTNVTEDHLNVHKTLDNYIECKLELVRNVLDDGFCILNSDDKYFDKFKNASSGKVLTYGMKESTLQIIGYDEYIDHTDIVIKYRDTNYSFSSNLLGLFNIYNLCAAFLTLISLDFDINYLISRLNLIKVPKGRFQFLNYGQNYNIILDYAHTTDAFSNIYKFLNKVKKKRIITVTGSAGGREKEKRKSMGKVVLDNSDYVIFTMDDPRSEDVNSIIDDLVSISDKTNYERIVDRKLAIKKAFDMALEDDIVLIAGKGCDNYMAVGTSYLPYNDFDVIKDYFEKDN